MAGRTFAIGDIHGDLDALETLLSRLPTLTSDDTLVFLGDYLDRGPNPAGVVRLVREVLPTKTSAKIVALRGNHEDAWLKVLSEGWLGFTMPPGNGCRSTVRSYMGLEPDAELHQEAQIALFNGSFFPEEIRAWMAELPYWYEDEHAIYVHAGVPRIDDRWPHPSEVEDVRTLLWSRSKEFFLEYDGKRMVVGHTGTSTLPEHRSLYTPDDDNDLYWAGCSAYGIDTGCGSGGFLTAFELPSHEVYESR